MKNEGIKNYLKTLFAVLLSIGVILYALWWYWDKHADAIIARVLRSSKNTQVLDELGQVLGGKGAEVLVDLIGKKKKR